MKSEQLESLASELMRREVYVLLASENAAFGSEHIAGLYGRRLDLQARVYLASLGRWQGRRPTVFVDDVRHDEHEVLAILLHELAHLADLGHDNTPEASVPEVSIRLAASVQARTIQTPVVPVSFDDKHSSRFVRACCHLHHRAWNLGHRISEELIFDGGMYGILSPYTAVSALGDELRRLEQLTIETILILPAPERFNALFEG
jgi:hypothetical protein